MILTAADEGALSRSRPKHVAVFGSFRSEYCKRSPSGSRRSPDGCGLDTVNTADSEWKSEWICLQLD